MLEEFETMLDGHLGRINIPKQHTDLEPSNQSPVHSRPYAVRRKATDFEIQEVKWMLAEKVMEPAQTEWADQMDSAEKTVGSPYFCIEPGKANAVMATDSSALPGMDECIDYLRDAALLPTPDVSSGY